MVLFRNLFLYIFFLLCSCQLICNFIWSCYIMGDISCLIGPPTTLWVDFVALFASLLPRREALKELEKISACLSFSHIYCIFLSWNSKILLAWQVVSSTKHWKLGSLNNRTAELLEKIMFLLEDNVLLLYYTCINKFGTGFNGNFIDLL